MTKYVEISQKAFNTLVSYDCPPVKEEWVVNSYHIWYYTKGVELLVIDKGSPPKKYYIADINS